MYKNIKVEAEHNELILENSHGDKVIIPTNKRNWVKQKLSEGCHSCIDSLVETLPVASQYAQDGSVYPPNKKVKINQNNQIKEYDINSPEYKDLYNSGKLMSYDKNTDTYIATPLKEATITAEAPQWLKDKREYEKTYSKQQFASEYLPKWAGELGETADNLSYNSLKEYDKRINDKVVENIFKRKPTFDTDYSNDRLKTLQGFSQKELELIKNSSYSSKIEPSIWSKFEQGLLSVGNAGSPVTFKNSSLTQEEAKKEDNPLNILQPLSIPSKIVQSTYKDDYSFTDALKGKNNNAGIVEDIITDPLNLIGLGIWGKLSKANKFKNLNEVYQNVKGLSKEEQLSKINNIVQDATKAGSKVLNKLDDVGEQAYKQWQLEELPGLHLKSTMEGQAISKIIEPKTGLINVEQALGIIGKESGGANKVSLIRKGLGENIPKKIDFNEFRKVIQDQLIPLERQFRYEKSDYGIDRIGYKSFNTPDQILENGKWVDNPLNKNIPLENQTLILGNKSKFGRGSSAHGNPDETLGHVHFLRDAETPDVLTVTQIQSDAFQGTHRIMPKNTSNATALERQKKSLQRMEELQERNKSVLNKMKTEGVDEAGLPVQKYQIKQFEDIVKAQEQSNLFKKADIENFTQKQLLDKNHQERYLQELVDYAGKRGDINKVRVPTAETAAKVQGYRKEVNPLYPEAKTKILNLEVEIKKHDDFFKDNFDHPKYKEKANKLASELEAAKKQEINSKEGYYSSEHQTILKKYSEQPKTIKKLFGQEPKIVTDKKGNTWYEFDIPKKFKEGKGEIKAFQVIPPAIGSALYLQSQNKNKSEQ